MKNAFLLKTAGLLGALSLVAGCDASAQTTGTLPSGTGYSVERMEALGAQQDVFSRSGPDALFFSGRPRDVVILIRSDNGQPFDVAETFALTDSLQTCAEGDIDSRPASTDVLYEKPDLIVMRFQCFEVSSSL